MRNRRISATSLFLRIAPVLCALSCGPGCSSSPKHTEPQPLFYAKRIIDEAAPEGTYQAVEREIAISLAAALAAQPEKPKPPEQAAPAAAAKPLNVLILSAGGQYATFAGGLLSGWTATGTRPDFDVVTGVSSGAMAAIYAYLGPKYDATVERLMNSVTSDNVFKFSPVKSLLCTNSLASSKPFQKFVDCEINAEVLADLRAAHQSGRRLFIGTMNARTRRLVIWDMGAIACSGRPDADQLVRKLVVASSSIPGLLPAVEFNVVVNGVRYREEHADGGAVAQSFIAFGPEMPRPDHAHPEIRWLAGSNLYAIAGGKLYADLIEGKMGMLKRATSTVSASLYALYRADLWRLYSICATSGMKFNFVAIPEEVRIEKGSTEFDHKTMRELYALGYDMATRGNFWRHMPPGHEPGEEEIPRAGVRFIVP
jgi:hypothetical protein